MNSTLWIAYLVLVGVSLLQAVLLALQAWEHRRYARACLADVPGHRPRGRAMILAPCKGAEVALEENLRGLLRQDYDDYEITFVVEDAEDPAAAVIRRVLAEHPHSAARLLVAGLAAEGGQKVHNLRAATADVPSAIRYLVFVDSDAQPRPDWLRSLIARLSAGEAAVVTGYRWFMPCRATLAQKIVYTINCTVMSLLGRSSHHLVWGGSWAIRRDTFDSLGLRAGVEGHAQRRPGGRPRAPRGPLRGFLRAGLRGGLAAGRFGAAGGQFRAPPISHRPALRRLLVAGSGGGGCGPHGRLAGHALCDRLRPGPRRAGVVDRRRAGRCTVRLGRVSPRGWCRTWRPSTFPIAWAACGRFGVSPSGPLRWRCWSSGLCWSARCWAGSWSGAASATASCRGAWSALERPDVCETASGRPPTPHLHAPVHTVPAGRSRRAWGRKILNPQIPKSPNPSLPCTSYSGTRERTTSRRISPAVSASANIPATAASAAG